MRVLLVVLVLFSSFGCSDSSNTASAPGYQIVNKNIYFGIYTKGSMPAGSIDIVNSSGKRASFGVEFLFLDQNNRIVSDSYDYVMDLPAGMRKEILIKSTKYFSYPEDGWSYIINVNRHEAERGQLPVKWK